MAFASTAVAANAQVSGSIAKVPALKASGSPSVSGQAADAAKMSATFSRLPLAFEANGGLLDPRVKFISRGAGYNLFLTGNEAVLSLAADKTGKGDVVRLKIAGANSKTPVSGLDIQPGKTNYFIGADPAKWRTNIANYSKVRYANVYRGIDLVYYGNQQQLEHDFVVAPGADPKRIAIEVNGAHKLRVDASGDLVLEAKNGELRFKKPLIYQEKNGARIEIAGGYQIEKQNRVTFQVGDYDHTRELTIDPVLNYSTYLSAASLVTGKAIAVDSSGNAYITGTVVTAGPFAPKTVTACATCGGLTNGDIFVAKLNAAGTGLTFLTMIGGTGADTSNAIALDASGNAYITGQTSSTDFPTTTNAFSRHLPIGSIQITNVGSSYNSTPTITFNGGGGSGAAATVALISQKVALITITNGGSGYTSAPTLSFSASGGSGAAATVTAITAGQPEVFVTKLHSDGTVLDYSTYLSGSGTSNVGNGIAVDGSGDIYVTGSTNSTDFSYVNGTTSTSTGAQTTGRGMQHTNAGSDDIFLVKLHPAGANTADLKYATYLGGAGSDVANALTAVGTDDVYLTGKTASAAFPTTAGAAQTAKGSTQDGFVVRVNTKSAPVTVANCTNSPATSVTITAANTFAVSDSVTISGVGKNSNGYDFEGTFTVATASGTQFTYLDAGCHGNPGSTTGGGSVGTNSAAVLANPKYATLMGGDQDDEGKAIAVDAAGNAFVTGSTQSTTGFPNGANAIQPTGLAGTTDAFIAKVAAGGGSFSYSAYLGGTGTTIGNAIFVNPGACGATCEAYVAGQTSTPTTAGLFDINALQSTNASPQDGFVARVNGAGNGLVYSTFLGGAGTDAITGMAGRFPASAEPEAYVVGTTDGSVSFTSSAFQTTPVTATGSFVAKLQANSNTQPGFSITGTQLTPVPPLPVGTDGTFSTPITYKWTVTNTNAASATTLDLTTPNDGSGHDLLTISGAPTFTGTVSGTCTTPRVGSVSGGPGGVTCSLGNITAGGSTIVAVSATPTSFAQCTTASCPGAINPIALQGTVASAEQPSGSNPATATLNLPNARIINLTVTGTATSNVTGGNVYNQAADTSLVYDISVNNVSLLSNDAANVSVSSTYPINFVVDNITTPAAGAGCLISGGVVTCPIAAIANGATGHVVFNGHFTQAASNPTLANLVSATGTVGDNTQVFRGTGSNTNVAINVDYRAPGADLDVTNNGGFSAVPNPVRAGQPLTFTVNYANNGPLDATNVTITQSFTNPSTAKFTATTMPSFCSQPGGAGTNLICAIPDSQMIAAVGGTGASAIAVVAGGNVTAVNMNTAGSGYTAVPAVSLVGGGGTGATATAVLTTGTVTSINVTAPGTGYTTAPAVVIASGAGGGAATATTDGDTITAITVNTPGAGYTTPTITLIGGGGAGATASAVVDGNGSITGITVDTPGFGYVTAPTVIISGPQSFTVSGAAPLDATQAFVNLGSTVTISTTGGTTDAPILNSSATLSPGPVIRHEAQLAVSGFSAPATVSNSSPGFNYTFSVSNTAGLDPADNTHVILSLPQNTNPVSSSPGGACGGTLTAPDCNIGTVGVGATVPVTVSVTPPSLSAGVKQGPNYLGSITSVASADAVNVCGGCITTAGPVTTNVQRQTALTLSSFVETNPAVGTGATATSTVAAGGVTAVNVTVPGTGYAVAPSVALVGGGGTGATATATVAAGAVTAINVTSPGTGYATPPTVIIAAAVSSTGSITYQATVNNAGVDAATNVVLGFNLPAGYTLTPPVTQVSGSVTLTCSGTAPLNCTIPSVASGGSQQVNVTITPPAVGTPTVATSILTASAQLDLSLSTSDFDSSGTSTLTSGSVTTIDERRADLNMVSANATAAVSSDGDITHTIQVISNGATATNVSVLLTFDHNYRFQSSNSASGLGAPVCNVTFTATTRTCTLPDLPSGTPYSFNVIVKPELGIVQTNNPTGNKTNVNLLSATISAAVIENPNTNPDTTASPAVTEVRRQADLLVVSNGLTPATQTTNSGGQTTYNLTVKNNGPDADSNGHVTFSFVSTTAPTVGQLLLFTASDFTGAAGLGSCTANSPAPGQVDCVLAAPFNSLQTRSGTIKITPPALTGGQTSASFDTTAIVQSTTAYDDNAGAPGTNNTSSTVPSTVQTQSDVKVTSVVASSPNLASPIAPGANIADSAPLQYTVTFTNVGDPAGTGANPVVLSHTLPDETILGTHYGYTVNSATWSSSLLTPGSCSINGVNAPLPPIVVTCRSTSGTIPSGDVITIKEDGFANIAPTQNPPSFSFTDSVTIPVNPGYIDPTPSNNSGNSQAFQVVRTADLGIVQSGGVVVTPILPGNVLDTPGANFEVTKHIAVQYDVTVQNLSASSSVSNVVVDSVLPSSPNTTALTFSSGTNCSVFAAGPPQTVRCTIPAPLGPAGGGTDTATVSFILTPNAALPASTSVQLSFNPTVSAAGNTDTNPSNNSNIPAAITIDRISDLGIAIAAPALSFPTVLPGTGGAAVVFPVNAASSGNYSYTINVSNGPLHSNANNVVVTDSLASNPVFGLAFVSGSWPAVAGTPGTPAGTCSAVGQNVTCNIGTLDAGATVPITLTVKPTLSTTTAQQAVVNSVSIASGTVSDQNGSNNSDSVTVLLRGKTDLQVAIVPTPLALPAAHANLSANANPAHAIVGDQVRYDVTVTNNGPYPAGSVITLTDTIDPKVSLLSIPANQFTCSGAPVITCTLNSGTLGVGSIATAKFITDVPASAIGAGLSTALLNNQAVVTQYSNGSNLSQDATDLDFALAAASNNNAANNISADIAADLAVTQTAPAQVLTAALLLPAAPNPAVFTVSVKANQDVTTLNTTPANLVDGRSTATNVVLTNVVNISPNNSVTSITVPAGCVASAVTALNATTDKATVTCNLNSIADGTTSQVSFSMRPTKPGTITNTPSVTSSNVIEVDPNTNNNTLGAAAVAAATINVNNTPPGPQTVTPVDPVTGLPNTNVSINFANVTTPGSSFVVVTTSGPSLGTSLLPTTKYYDLSSAAISDLPITVCINYTGTSFLNPERVRLEYFASNNAPNPLDITTSLDQVTHIVCGQLPSNLPASVASPAAFAVSEPRNTPPHNAGAIAPTASPSQQSSGKGVTGTSVTLSSAIVDSDINQGCYTPIGSNASSSSANLCSDVLTFTWTGQFTDGTTQTFSCPAPYTVACQTKDVSVSTTSQTLTLVVRDQTGDPVTGVFSTTVSLSATNTGGGSGSSSVTVNKGQTASFSNVLTVTYTGSTPLTLTLIGAPSLTANQITCTASPATLAGPVTNQAVTVLCSTQGQVFAMSAPPRNTGRGDAPILASMVGLSSLPLVGMLLLPGKSRRKRMLKVWAIFGLLVLLVAFQASCGGGGGSSFGGAPVLQNAGTPAGTYTVNISPATGLTVLPAGTSLTLIVQ